MNPTSSSPQTQGNCKPWKTSSWHNFPIKAFACILGSLISISSSFALLALADDSPVDSWAVAPTIILSIMVTLSNSMMRAAFSVGAEVFWWSSLVPQSGTTLGELHYIWDLAYNSLSTITNFESFQPLIRLSNMLVIAIAVNGPLLQRAIRVELDTRTSFQEQTLQIRREPMWDLTAKTQGLAGFVFSIVPYQDEFAEAVLEQRQREPLHLPTTACPLDATCTTSVVVAGFTRQCSDSEESTKGLLSLPPASAIIFQTSGSRQSVSVHKCSQTGSHSNTTGSNKDSGMCEALTTYFQLHFENPSQKPTSPSTGELPWKAPDLPPGRANYTSYIRTNTSVDTVAVRNCNFSTSFIELPIRISNGTTVTMLSAESPIGLSSTNGIESIPHPLDDEGRLDHLFTGGFVQALSDMYSGYIVYNSIDPGHIIQGSGPRQFINQSSIVPRRIKSLPSPEPNDVEFYFPSHGYDFTCFDPLNDFVTSLNELSLRYALKSVSDKGMRAREMEGLKRFFGSENQSSFDKRDLRPRAASLLSTTISPTQVASMTVSKAIPVYRVSYIFTAIAVGVSFLASLFIVLLLMGWRKLGRTVSLSPLELAKGFDAPLLANAWSNCEGEELAKTLGKTKVRYGVVPEYARLEGVGTGGVYNIATVPSETMEDTYTSSEMDSLSSYNHDNSQSMMIYSLD